MRPLVSCPRASWTEPPRDHSGITHERRWRSPQHVFFVCGGGGLGGGGGGGDGGGGAGDGHGSMRSACPAKLKLRAPGLSLAPLGHVLSVGSLSSVFVLGIKFPSL